MGNCFGIFGDTGPLLDNVETDDTLDTETEEGFATQSPVYHPHPGLAIPASRLTEEEQVQIAKRMDMIQFLPSASYVPTNKDRLKECIICMCDLKLNDDVRYLPCLHTYHRACIDDWLMRSFVCPSCLRPIELDMILESNRTAPKETCCESTTEGNRCSLSRQSSEPDENGTHEAVHTASPIVISAHFTSETVDR